MGQTIQTSDICAAFVSAVDSVRTKLQGKFSKSSNDSSEKQRDPGYAYVNGRLQKGTSPHSIIVEPVCGMTDCRAFQMIEFQVRREGALYPLTGTMGYRQCVKCKWAYNYNFYLPKERVNNE